MIEKMEELMKAGLWMVSSSSSNTSNDRLSPANCIRNWREQSSEDIFRQHHDRHTAAEKTSKRNARKVCRWRRKYWWQHFQLKKCCLCLDGGELNTQHQQSIICKFEY